MRSKGKQLFEAISCGRRSIGTQIAVGNRPLPNLDQVAVHRAGSTSDEPVTIDTVRVAPQVTIGEANFTYKSVSPISMLLLNLLPFTARFS